MVLRCVPPLHIPNSALVDFLTRGYGYDEQSVRRLIQEGNAFFDRRELKEALTYYGIGYEIYRLQAVYPPLAHDILVRRVLCFSMLGELEKALAESGNALCIIPNSPSMVLIRGIVLSKMGRVDEANGAFHRACEHNPDLRDMADCIVALFMQAHQHFDRSVQICTQVLARSPRSALALLVRGGAYKYHCSGYFVKQAAGDYSAMLELDQSLEPFLTIDEQFSTQNCGRVDDLLLRFHPTLLHDFPKPIEDYAMASKRQPLLVSCLVTYAIGRLKSLVQSAHLIKSIRKQEEQLLERRAAVERRMQQLADVQARIANVESHGGEVWGPADPDHSLVRKYRRHWMERPMNFPLREGRSASAERAQPSRAAHSSSAFGSTYPPHVGIEAERAVDILSSYGRLSLSSIQPEYVEGFPAVQQECPPMGQLAAAQCAAQCRSGGSSSASLMASIPPTPGAPRLAETLRTPTAPPVSIEAPLSDTRSDRLGTTSISEPEPVAEPAAPPTAPPTTYGGSTYGDSPARPALSAAQAASSGDVSCTVSEPSNVEKYTLSRAAVKQPMPPATGAGWDESQWVAKALEMVDAFAAAEGGSTLGKVDLKSAPRKSLPTNFITLECPKTPPPSGRTFVQLTQGGEDINIVEAVENGCMDVIHNWFPALDHVYEMTDMVQFSAKPDSLYVSADLQGREGFSYVVPPKHACQAASRPLSRPSPRPSSRPASARGYRGPTRASVDRGQSLSQSLKSPRAETQPDDELIKRYQNRLMATTLP